MTPHAKQLQPSLYFYVGLAIVMLIFWMSFIPNWTTFVHVWKVEFFASILLLAASVFAYRHHSRVDFASLFSKDETRLILIPLIAFVVWSLASALWANSWRSAVHHTLVWTLYLTFYAIVRHSLNKTGHYRKFLFVFAGCLILCALPAIAGYVSIIVFGGGNTLGIRFSRFGEQVAVLLPLTLIAVVKLRGRNFNLGLIAVSALWLLVFCSISRAGMLMFIAATLATGVIIFIKSRIPNARLKFAAVIVVVIASPILLQSFLLVSDEATSPSTQRLADSGGVANSNDFRKLMASLSLEMFLKNPIAGVGADNFGFEVHRYREAYAASNPSDPYLAQAESTIPERSHNEYLQILAELGIVGAAIFAWFLIGIGVMAFRVLKRYRRLPIHAPAAAVGFLMFLAGALVTSYSFRLIQNGFVFFFVLAVASKLILRDPKTDAAEPARADIDSRWILAPAIAACLLLFTYSSIRVASVILAEAGNRTREITKAEEFYGLAAELDGENPSARNYRGMRLFREQRFAEAIPHLAAAIDIGLATSDSFSYLATAQALAGDSVTAEQTMARAAILYPRSVFVLVRYAQLQQENGRHSDALSTVARAELIDARAARTWQSMINSGFRIASAKEATEGSAFASVMDLQPQNGIYAVLSERLIRNPDEQRDSLFRAVNTAQPAAAVLP